MVGKLSLSNSELPASFAKFSCRPDAVNFTPVSNNHPDTYSMNTHQAYYRGKAVQIELYISIEWMLKIKADEFKEQSVLHHLVQND